MSQQQSAPISSIPGRPQRKAGFWRDIWHWWTGLKTELKVLFAIVTGICYLVVTIISNGHKASPTPALSVTPAPNPSSTEDGPSVRTATATRNRFGEVIITASFDPQQLKQGKTLTLQVSRTRDFRRNEELVPEVNVGSLATTVVTAKLDSDPENIPFYCRFLAKSAQNTRVGPIAEVQVR